MDAMIIMLVGVLTLNQVLLHLIGLRLAPPEELIYLPTRETLGASNASASGQNCQRAE